MVTPRIPTRNEKRLRARRLRSAKLKVLFAALYLGLIFISLAYSERLISLVILGVGLVLAFFYVFRRARLGA